MINNDEQDEWFERIFGDLSRPEQEELSWQRFIGRTLPESEAWAGFELALVQASLRLYQSLDWLYQGVPVVQ